MKFCSIYEELNRLKVLFKNNTIRYDRRV